MLQEFRDRVLLPSHLGKRLVAWYYQVGPQLASFVAPYPAARMVVRTLLYPLVWGIRFPVPALALVSGFLFMSWLGLVMMRRRAKD